MNHRKILMLWPVKEDYWPRIIEKNEGISVASTFKKKSFLGNIVRKFCALSNMGIGNFLGEWKHDIHTYDIIIVQAAKVTAYIPEWLRKRGYKGRIIYWYWDPVSGSVSPQKIDRSLCELWSFDQRDCKQYHMKYNETYYPIDNKDMECSQNIELYDVCYIGRDKGRLKELREIESALKKEGLLTYFYIVATKPYYISSKKLMPPVGYNEVLKIVKASKAILDINQAGQSGLSMRCMESVFFDKKLITNNSFIKEYEFFNSENIYVLGEDKRNISEFLKIPIISNSVYRNQFLFKNWLKVFFEEEDNSKV